MQQRITAEKQQKLANQQSAAQNNDKNNKNNKGNKKDTKNNKNNKSDKHLADQTFDSKNIKNDSKNDLKNNFNGSISGETVHTLNTVSGAKKKQTPLNKKKARRYAEQDEEDRELAMLILGTVCVCFVCLIVLCVA